MINVGKFKCNKAPVHNSQVPPEPLAHLALPAHTLAAALASNEE